MCDSLNTSSKLLLFVDSSNRFLVESTTTTGSQSSLARLETLIFVSEPLETAQKFDSKIERTHFLGYGQVNDVSVAIFCAALDQAPSGYHFLNFDELEMLSNVNGNSQLELKNVLNSILPYLVDIPYLALSDNEYIYRFRTNKERNRSVYITKESEALYQSDLCMAIKKARRQKEKTSGQPAILDFGAVRYLIPSHFGFCLGVQNAIERAYETVASNPGKRVFMLSELIHNPFVNEDLLKRGLRYLQTDKGLALRKDGTIAESLDDSEALWNLLESEDVVIIPAFGATNEDKIRLMRKGISIRENDATCMLVEKVWKAAKRYSKEGYTVLIHGKSEHEETKATFSNSSSYGPALMIRNIEHAKVLGEVLLLDGIERRQLFEVSFAGLYSKGFDPMKDLDRIAVVNQTTLLRNETLGIIDYLRGVLSQKYGEDKVEHYLWSKGKGDTLCYATQVNQDALHKAVEQEVDAAIVVGGKNSSNTFQLFRVCESRFGDKAHYIQSEANIRSREEIVHYIFPYSMSQTPKQNEISKSFLPNKNRPMTVLLTGGASCPDGIIQQVIHRVNGLFPKESVYPIEQILDTFNTSS